jgi:hypothetical protein
MLGFDNNSDRILIPGLGFLRFFWGINLYIPALHLGDLLDGQVSSSVLFMHIFKSVSSLFLIPGHIKCTNNFEAPFYTV